MKINILKHFIKDHDENQFTKSSNCSEASDITKTLLSSRCYDKSDSHDEYIDVQNINSNRGSVSLENTISEVNLSNVFEPNTKLILADSYIWPEVNMSVYACDGHECMDEGKDLNETILYQPIMRKIKPNFTPPMFPASGILSCPDIKVEEETKEMKKTQPSDLRNEMDYLIPGNLEFIQFTYPKLGKSFRYSTFAIPNNRYDWEWVYKHMQKIMNSFRRKYLCEVLLATEPGFYKGKIAYLVRIESDTQGNILRCRSGLPAKFKEMLVTPFNAINDINCYITEYLIKRKFVFKKISSQECDEDKLRSNKSGADESTVPIEDNNENIFGRPLSNNSDTRNGVDFQNSNYETNRKSRSSLIDQDQVMSSRSRNNPQ